MNSTKIFYNITKKYNCNENNSCYNFSDIFIIYFFFTLITYWCFLRKNKVQKKINKYNLYFKDKKSEDYNIKNCVICFDDINYDNLAILKCNHYFHEDCIKKWFESNLNCPICRNNFNNVI